MGHRGNHPSRFAQRWRDTQEPASLCTEVRAGRAPAPAPPAIQGDLSSFIPTPTIKPSPFTPKKCPRVPSACEESEAQPDVMQSTIRMSKPRRALLGVQPVLAVCFWRPSRNRPVVSLGSRGGPPGWTGAGSNVLLNGSKVSLVLPRSSFILTPESALDGGGRRWGYGR